MRHRVFGRKLSKDTKERQSLFKSLISSLIVHGQIKTTEPRAKAIKGLVDKLMVRAKQGTLHARQMVTAFFQDKKVANKLLDELTPVYKKRPSGFTRTTRLGTRKGDQAMMVKLEMMGGEADQTAKVEEPNKKEAKDNDDIQYKT